MRYMQIDNIEFRDSNGNINVIKDMREIPVYNLLTKIKINENTYLDEVATRNEIYGEAREDLSYAIFENNIIEITENNFSLNKIKTLKIPVVN